MDYQEFIETKIKEIKGLVGSEKAINALSGGVDSSTVTVLGHRAIGDQLKTIFIDTGVMRENEPDSVISNFNDLGIKVELVDAQDEFFRSFKGIEDPEEKRKAFRNTFYTVLGRAVKESGAHHLLQGTIAADIVETKGGIKTQHNVLDQIGIDSQSYGFKLIEPLKDLYKGEVRKVAKQLGLPEESYEKMPFPGPGLSCRVIGEVTRDRVGILKKATTIVENELKDLHPFLAAAILLKDKATGVIDGKRAFGDIICVRAVESKDAMSAEVTEVPWEILRRLEKRITSEISSITKVLYDLSPKPPSTIEYI